MPNQKSNFDLLLEKIKSIHDKKAHDYSKTNDRFSNFKAAAIDAGCGVEVVFRVLIGVKDARLKELLDSGKKPNNESIEDTILDRAIYTLLWLAWRMEK